MVLNTRKGDLRGLSPDPAPRGPQAPPLSRPPADARPRLLPRSSGGPGGIGAAAGVPQSRGTQSPGASVLWAKAQGGRRLLPERSSGDPGPAVSRRMHRGFRLRSGGSRAPWAWPGSF